MAQRKRKFFVQWNLLTQGKVKRFYALKIPDYSSKSLRTIFDKHISKTAQVTTDQWKGYKPIKDFNITQISSNDGKNFPTLHKVIHQVKSWIRGIYSWVSEFNIAAPTGRFAWWGWMRRSGLWRALWERCGDENDH